MPAAHLWLVFGLQRSVGCCGDTGQSQTTPGSDESADAWKEAPVLPVFDRAARNELKQAVAAADRAGLRPRVFAEVGDSDTGGLTYTGSASARSTRRSTRTRPVRRSPRSRRPASGPSPTAGRPTGSALVGRDGLGSMRRVAAHAGGELDGFAARSPPPMNASRFRPRSAVSSICCGRATRRS